MIPKDATSALDPFDLESSLRQTVFLFNGTIVTADALEVESADIYRSKIEEVAREG